MLAVLLGGLAVVLIYHFGLPGTTTSSSTEGSGTPATQIRHVRAFDRVDLAGINNVSVRVGGKQSVLVRADDNLLAHVTTTVRSHALVVANTPGAFTTRSPMSVEITVPTLEGVTLSGTGNVVVHGVQASSLAVDLPGSGTITGTGTATRLDVTVDGSGSADLTGLVARDVQATVSGTGSILVTATASLAASVTGSGSILYTGNPRHVHKKVTGTGAITGS